MEVNVFFNFRISEWYKGFIFFTYLKSEKDVRF